MSATQLTKTRIQAGIYEGVVKSSLAEMPEIDAYHLGRVFGAAELSEDPTLEKTWHLRLPVPVELLSDGIQTFVLQDRRSGDVLDNFCIVTGEAPDDNLAAELDLLRAELDMLKRAFRRHCLETG